MQSSYINNEILPKQNPTLVAYFLRTKHDEWELELTLQRSSREWATMTFLPTGELGLHSVAAEPVLWTGS
jgi:hypothetical protein